MQNKSHERLQSENCSPKRKKRKVLKKGAANDLEDCFEVIDADAHVPRQQMSPYWLKGLELRDSDKVELLSGKWLTDKHISAVSKLLRKQHPQQNGLQDTLVLAVKLQWTSNCTNFVQIINICKQHWVCSSNIGCPEGGVDIYDSIPAYSTGSTTLKKQIAAILNTKSPSLKLRFIDVQRQNGGGDCALFAIANTVALCLGQDPHLIRYDQSQMRSHLFESFQQGKLTSFPEKEKPRRMRQRLSSTTEVALYCCCRQPHTGGRMIQCHACKEWFHDICKPDIPREFWNTTKKWFCSRGKKCSLAL